MGPFFTFLATQSVERDVLAAIIGLCVGSFLNVVALRTLAEKPFWNTIVGSSACPHCNHRLGPLDLIPILSYLMLGRKCRYCKQSISWSYPVVEIVTAITFVVLLHHYQVVPGSSYSSDDIVRAVMLDSSMLVFFGILIAICVTDFKEKLIPHEITYPSILVGIAFSAWARQDFMPTLAGIGISYILFDFLAFYGLKMYYLMHRDEEGAKQLDHAVRAIDGDTLATVRVAKIETIKDGEHVLHTGHSEHAELVERGNHTPETEHASALHQLEEAVVRSAMFAEAEDAVPDRVIILAEPGEPLSEASETLAKELPEAPLTEQKQSIDESLDSHRGETVKTSDGTSETAHQATLDAAGPVEEDKGSFKETALNEPSSVKLVAADAETSTSTAVTVNASVNTSAVDSSNTTQATKSISTKPAGDSPDEFDFHDPEIDEAFGISPPVPVSDEDDQDFEVMGGGDAVLAALIAAWLGLENLGITLVLGFMIGSLMGSCYLAYELHKLGTLNKALKSTGLIIAVLLVISEGSVYWFASNTGMTAPGHELELRQLPWTVLGIASIFGGILLGTITNGREGSKPFPFGPALAVAAAVVVFADPFHKLIISDECIRLGTLLLEMGHN